MPIIEQYESRGWSQSYGKDTRFLVYVIDSGDPDIAAADPDLPVIGDLWPLDSNLICVDRSVLRVAPTHCQCVATFAPRVQEERFSCPTEQVTIDASLDRDDEGRHKAIGPFRNQQPQGVNVLRSTYKTLQIIRWETDFDENALARMVGKVNDKFWRGWPGTTDNPPGMLEGPGVTGFWLIADISIASSRPLTFGAPGSSDTIQLAQISYTFLLSTAIQSPETDGWGPGWLWTWYKRDNENQAIRGDPQIATIYEDTNFDVLNLDPTP